MDDGRAPAEARGAATNRLVSVDALRGLAALAVVLTHLPFSWQGTVASSPPVAALPRSFTVLTDYGQYGVHLFLILSGFCIHMGWARRQLRGQDTVAFVDFWSRRLRRLYPPYFVALLASLAGMFALARLAHVPLTSPASALGYASDGQLAVDLVLLVLLAQNLNGASERVGNGPFWSLALEEQLYVLYFPLLAMRRRWGWLATLAVAMVTSLAWRAVYGFSDTAPVYWYLCGPARWIEWVLGAWAVEAHLGLVKLPRWASSWPAVVAAALIAVVVSPPGHAYHLPGAGIVNDLAFGLACFFLVNTTCRLEREGAFVHGRPLRGLRRLGIMSYSLYLTHNPVMVGAKRVAVMVGVGSVGAILVIRLAAALLVALLFFLVVERRFLNTAS
jgi:peptidoglycan/LPS O-acetylase OafA/YrhL